MVHKDVKKNYTFVNKPYQTFMKEQIWFVIFNRRRLKLEIS